MAKKVMKLIDASTGLMECKICEARHYANIGSGGKYLRGSWQCPNGCVFEDSEEGKSHCRSIKATLHENPIRSQKEPANSIK